MGEDEFEQQGSSRLDALKAQIANRRWREELRGVEFKGIRWHADSDGRQAVMETLQFAARVEASGGTFTTDWKGQDGKWAGSITIADLEQVAAMLGQRRANAFARERELLAMAEADPEGFDERVIGEGWPA